MFLTCSNRGRSSSARAGWCSNWCTTSLILVIWAKCIAWALKSRNKQQQRPGKRLLEAPLDFFYLCPLLSFIVRIVHRVEPAPCDFSNKRVHVSLFLFFSFLIAARTRCIFQLLASGWFFWRFAGRNESNQSTHWMREIQRLNLLFLLLNKCILK